jgi:hypothetical protein
MKVLPSVTTVAVILCGAATAVRANHAQGALANMTDAQRADIFLKFMERSGEPCATVSRTFYQGSDQQGNAFWDVKCAGGGSFVIMVNNDATGSTRILSCAVLKRVNGGTCFKKF